MARHRRCRRSASARQLRRNLTTNGPGVTAWKPSTPWAITAAFSPYCRDLLRLLDADGEAITEGVGPHCSAIPNARRAVQWRRFAAPQGLVATYASNKTIIEQAATGGRHRRRHITAVLRRRAALARLVRWCRTRRFPGPTPHAPGRGLGRSYRKSQESSPRPDGFVGAGPARPLR